MRKISFIVPIILVFSLFWLPTTQTSGKSQITQELFSTYSTKVFKKPVNSIGNIKVLVLLLQPKGQEITFDSDQMRMKFVGDKWSVQNYFDTASYGKAKIDYGPDGIKDWIEMPQTYDDIDPLWIAFFKEETDFSQIMTLILNSAKEVGYNLDYFDEDKNGEPDIIVTLWAGNSLTFGGRGYGDFSFETEKGSKMVCTAEDPKVPGHPIVIAIHELCHGIGLFDVYDYSGWTDPVGKWDIMSGGSGYINHGEVGMCSYQRLHAGWIEPEVITEPGVYEIEDLNGNGEHRMYKIPLPGVPTEWLCIENRCKTGLDAFWAGCPQDGLLIYQVDERRPYAHRFNTLTNENSSFGFMVQDTGYFVFDPLYIPWHVTAAYGEDYRKYSINAESWPNTLPWNRNNKPLQYISITDISKVGTKMTFKLGYTKIKYPVASVEENITFGKVVKGKKDTKKVTFTNLGSGNLNVKLKAIDPWIELDRYDFVGNDEDIFVTVDTTTLDLGKISGSIMWVDRDKTGKIKVNVEISPIWGDVNKDGIVNEADLEIFIKSFGKAIDESGFNRDCDFNDDGFINVIDLMMMGKNYKK